MVTTPTPQAGWRTDPENPSLQRFWDGSKWTDGVRAPVVQAELRASQVIPLIVFSNLITAVIVAILFALISANGGF
ncbi:DUF2510 domain-containing protein [Rhodococcus sp. NM-2]|uniref:DUF2510 domain-containing protein n=1 Tax=Rhodococcus sp. NM-2 TaxID=3401174 RepID=UPI003AABBEF6